MPFDPSAAALPGSGVFGLPHSEAEAAVVLLPVPFEATTSYGGGAAHGGPELAAAAARVNAASDEVNGWVQGEVARLIATGKRVVVIGGDHSVAFGSIAAHAQAF